MPKVKLSEKILNKNDFYPFKSSSAKIAMTAQIVYSKIDSKHVSTHSQHIIKEVLRKQIGFKGLMRINVIFKINAQGLVVDVKARAPQH